MPWLRLSGFAAAVALLHVLGWGIFAWYAGSNPALAGLGVLAYTFGLRHAFDADHIAAIDNTTRKFLQDGRRSVGTGFFFSLGHSTVVLALCSALAVADTTVNAQIPALQAWGGYLGTGVSGTFLLLIGLLNLAVLLDILRIFREMRGRGLDEERLEARLLDRGLMSRGILRRLGDRVTRSWHMYPLGILFGLGFDTATEVALLALSAGAATKHVPFVAVLSLPLLFAAGIGGIELLQVAARSTWIDFNTLGYGIVGLFVLTWTVSAVVWKARRIEDRWRRCMSANAAP